MSLTSSALLLATLLLGQSDPPDLHQDFRESQSLLAGYRFFGPNTAKLAAFEKEGLRITLPAERKQHFPVGILLNFTLSGDFELTAAYELLSATKPSKGYGAGVAISIAPTSERTKFAKVGRFLRPKEGNAYLTEFWTNEPEKDYQLRHEPTEVQAGRLRLLRRGERLHYLVADGQDGEFRQLWENRFGTDDIKDVKLSVVDSGAPGNPIDVRLLELTVRAPEIPAQASQPTAEPPPPATKDRSAALWLTLIAGTVLAVGVIAVLLLLRKPKAVVQSNSEPGAAAATIAFPCSACGKNLKVKAALAGSRVKCPHCGQATAVPRA